MISTLKDATEKLSIDFCHYNCDCGTFIDHKHNKVYEGQSGVDDVLSILFTAFNTQDKEVMPKEEALNLAFNTFSCCGYTSECGDNNIEEIFNEVYEYFDNSLTDCTEFLCVLKAVELNLINYDADVYLQHTTAYADMDEEWVYKKSLLDSLESGIMAPLITKRHLIFF